MVVALKLQLDECSVDGASEQVDALIPQARQFNGQPSLDGRSSQLPQHLIRFFKEQFQDDVEGLHRSFSETGDERMGGLDREPKPTLDPIKRDRWLSDL